MKRITVFTIVAVIFTLAARTHKFISFQVFDTARDQQTYAIPVKDWINNFNINYSIPDVASNHDKCSFYIVSGLFITSSGILDFNLY